ncbi:hypothetical protein [Flavobacterium orientale]|nr:hypothetical protein [Flavobacterium orientale]
MNTNNKTQDFKLYSSRAIGLATFLGGPLAAGYLIGENYKVIDKPTEGRNSLVLGIVFTVLLFGALFMIPENTIDKIPKQLIPLLYTGIILGIVEWKQGDMLKAHKENNNPFFSGWRAAGVGFVSLLVLVIGIFGYAFLSSDNEIYEKYDTELAQFSKNEKESLVFYDNLETKNNSSLLKELDEKTIPKWKANLEIIKKTNQLNNLPPDLVEQNNILLKYSELRIQAFELFRKSIYEDTDKYEEQLEQIHIQIEKELEKLN